MSTIFVTTYNYREQGPDLETPIGESLTQPDQVLSIREMLTRHVRGLPVPNAKDPGQFYDEELGYIPSRDELDLADIDDYRQKYAEVVQRLQNLQDNPPKIPKSDEVDKPQESESPGDSDSDVKT